MPSTSSTPSFEYTTRRATLEDMPQLQQLYVDTIKNVCRNEYSEEQLEAWSLGIEDKERWEALFTEQLVIVAMKADDLVGFASLENGNYIDMFYVHKDFQGKGLASLLYSVIEKEALLQGTTQLSSHISKTARPFFERKGFKIEEEQTFPLRGVMISNFRMSKMIG